MSRIDRIMNKYSFLKNFALPAGFTDGKRGDSSGIANPFNFGNWGQVPDKLFAPWSVPSEKNISSMIAPVQFQRLRYDVAMWRDAIREAELAILPFRVKMQRMYVDTVLNPHVLACMTRRKQLTLLREFEITDAKGNVSEDLTEQFKQKWFYDFIDMTLDSIFYGYSLIQLGDIVEGVMQDIDMVRRFNVSPDRRCVAIFEYAVTGIPIDDPEFSKWLVWVPSRTEIGISHCGYGLLYKVANIELYHRYTLQQNADYCEMFAHPFRLAKTDKTQENGDRQQLMKMLQNMGSQAWGVIDKNDELEFITDRSGTGYQSYGEFYKWLEGLISKAMLGHVNALDETPGKIGGAQGGKESPGAIALDDIKIHDGRLIQYVVPNLLFPKLRALGMAIPEGYKLSYKNDDEVLEGLQSENQVNLLMAQMVYQLKQAGFDVDPKWITDRSDIPVTKAAVETGAPGQTPEEKQRAENFAKSLKLFYGKED